MSLQVTIGTAPCSWGVWWPDGTPSGTPYDIFLDQAAEAGYKALELGPVGYLPTDIGQLREELARRDLSICGGTAMIFSRHVPLPMSEGMWMICASACRHSMCIT